MIIGILIILIVVPIAFYIHAYDKKAAGEAIKGLGSILGKICAFFAGCFAGLLSWARKNGK